MFVEPSMRFYIERFLIYVILSLFYGKCILHEVFLSSSFEKYLRTISVTVSEVQSRPVLKIPMVSYKLLVSTYGPETLTQVLDSFS